MSLLAPQPERFTLLNVTLSVTTNDAAFLAEFNTVFGGRHAETIDCLPAAELHATLSLIGVATGELLVSGDAVADPAEFLLRFSSPTIPLRPCAGRDPGWDGISLGDDTEPMFWFRDKICRFRPVGRWRRILAHFLFLRMLAMRREALFFHAASVGVGEHGVLLIGAKGSGKSTISLGMAARGHHFLGDETAAYVPANRLLLPFRRPAGLKPGPRAEAVSSALRRVRAPTDEEGILRIDVNEFFDLPAARPLPLEAVVFLRGFTPQSSLERVQPGREELALMQPIAVSLSSEPATARVFEMIRLLGSVTCYKMTAGFPDLTIDMLERALLNGFERH